MANLNEENVWPEGIYQLETTDPVLGGNIEEGGISNKQAKQLADRTLWLKSRIGVISNGLTEIDVESNVTVPPEGILGKKVILAPIQTGKTATFQIDALPNGAYIDITVRAFSGDLGKFVKIEWSGGFGLLDWNYSGQTLWLYAGETVRIVKYPPRTYIDSHNSQLNTVSDIKYSYKKPSLSIEARGQILNRADYPRLFNRVGNAGAGGAIISDTQWLSSINYSGCFSYGNGSTTFRVPDLRGVLIRGLDNGRGIDLGRTYNSSGGYEADDNKQHSHSVSIRQNIATYNPSESFVHVLVTDTDNSGNSFFAKTTSNSGGAESRPKNVAYTAYILL